MKFTLSTKLFALTTFVVTLVMATVTWFVTVGQDRDRRAAVHSEAKRLARSVANFKTVDYKDWSAYQQFISNLVADSGDVVFIAVFDERQELRAHAINVGLVDIDPENAQSQRAREALVDRLARGAVAEASRRDLHLERVDIQAGERVLGSVRVGVSEIDARRHFWQDLRRNALLALVFLFLSGAIALFLSRRLTRPIERLSTAMQAIAAGDLEQRVRPETHDEIGALAGTFNQMAEGLRERRILDELGQELGATFQLERLGKLVRERLTVAIGASSARLFLKAPDRPGLFREAGAEAVAAPGSEAILPPAAEAALATAHEGVSLTGAEPVLRQALAAAGLGPAELLVPLLTQGRLRGFFAFRVRGGEAGIDPTRRHFAGVLARQAALALDNALLYEDLRDQERLKGELDAAREVQRRLLPREMPSLAGWQFEGLCRPAFEVGGDYYDFLPLPDGRLGLVVADVSGKGSPASMYMAQLKGMIFALLGATPSPAALLAELNRRIHPTLDRRVFASVLYGVLEPASGRFVYARAGHCPLVVLRASGTTEVRVPAGIAVGIDPGPLFEKILCEEAFVLAPGDLMLAHTDGLIDATNPEHRSFGAERLLLTLVGKRSLPLDALRAQLLADLDAFRAGSEPFDDLTVLLVRRDPPFAAARGTRPGEDRMHERGES